MRLYACICRVSVCAYLICELYVFIVFQKKEETTAQAECDTINIFPTFSIVLCASTCVCFRGKTMVLVFFTLENHF